LAYVCPQCRQVHPEGAVSCAHARELIDKRGQEIKHEMDHHRIEHPDCPDAYTHVIRLRHEREAARRKPLGPIGVSV